MCGGNHWTGSLSLSSGGSPPRVWGNAKDTGRLATTAGSPPRVWGKAIVISMPTTSARDHPHVCGEKLRLMTTSGNSLGSPPRVWGKVACRGQALWTPRITPTCVGKRTDRKISTLDPKDHPHVCGEKA